MLVLDHLKTQLYINKGSLILSIIFINQNSINLLKIDQII